MERFSAMKYEIQIWLMVDNSVAEFFQNIVSIYKNGVNSPSL